MSTVIYLHIYVDFSFGAHIHFCSFDSLIHVAFASSFMSVVARVSVYMYICVDVYLLKDRMMCMLRLNVCFMSYTHRHTHCILKALEN